jgi:enoyl-CoA hydratase/carnithine racemase
MRSASHTIDERVSISLLYHVADLRLTRPDKMNALDLRTFAALDAAAKWIEE